jgi:hypothetical protein
MHTNSAPPQVKQQIPFLMHPWRQERPITQGATCPGRLDTSYATMTRDFIGARRFHLWRNRAPFFGKIERGICGKIWASHVYLLSDRLVSGKGFVHSEALPRFCMEDYSLF